MSGIDGDTWQRMAGPAWQARDRARVHGKTRVGAAVLASDGEIFSGCNVEHIFRSHDIHAEVNALGSMVATGQGPAIAILVVADRQRFTPCGGCLDWIFELGGPSCAVGFQSAEHGSIETLRADELMPHYPT